MTEKDIYESQSAQRQLRDRDTRNHNDRNVEKYKKEDDQTADKNQRQLILESEHKQREMADEKK